MRDSTEWALEAMEKANTIYEPADNSLAWQMMEFAVYAVEVALAVGLAILLAGGPGGV